MGLRRWLAVCTSTVNGHLDDLGPRGAEVVEELGDRRELKGTAPVAGEQQRDDQARAWGDGRWSRRPWHRCCR